MNVYDKRVIIERPDGGISILVPVGNKLPEETDTKFLNRLVIKVLAGMPGAVKKGTIDKTGLPFANPEDTTDIEDYVLDKETHVVSRHTVPDKIRHCRNCWRWDGSKIVVDSTLEAEARWATVRAIRDKLLVLSDGPMARESEQAGPKKNDYEAYRQSLRNVPQEHQDPNDITWPTKP